VSGYVLCSGEDEGNTECVVCWHEIVSVCVCVLFSCSVQCTGSDYILKIDSDEPFLNWTVLARNRGILVALSFTHAGM